MEISDSNTQNRRTREIISFISPYISRIHKSWKKIALINLVVITCSGLFLVFVVKDQYSSTITILPEYGGSRLLGGLSGLAAVAGLSVGETIPTMIYQKLLESESVLEPVIYQKYKTNEYKDSVTLIEYYELEPTKIGPKESTFLQERDKFSQMTERFSAQIMKSDFDRISNILTISIQTPERQLSSDIANTLAKSLDSYVKTKRKSNAIEQRIYIDKRIEQVRSSLTATENKLAKFRESNRGMSNSPQLMLEQGRLLRAMEIDQTIFVELSKQLEFVRLEEIKDSPILNIKEEAKPSIFKAGPKRLFILLIIGFLTVSASVFYFLVENEIREVILMFKSNNM